MSVMENPEAFVNTVSTKGSVAGFDCWSPITITLAPSINWFDEERTNTFKTAGSLDSQETLIRITKISESRFKMVFILFRKFQIYIIFFKCSNFNRLLVNNHDDSVAFFFYDLNHLVSN